MNNDRVPASSICRKCRSRARVARQLPRNRNGGILRAAQRERSLRKSSPSAKSFFLAIRLPLLSSFPQRFRAVLWHPRAIFGTAVRFLSCTSRCKVFSSSRNTAAVPGGIFRGKGFSPQANGTFLGKKVPFRVSAHLRAAASPKHLSFSHLTSVKSRSAFEEWRGTAVRFITLTCRRKVLIE
jgi:hypothetical protein